MPDTRNAIQRRPKSAAQRWIPLMVGGALAYALGGPLGFFAACLFIFVIRLWNATAR